MAVVCHRTTIETVHIATIDFSIEEKRPVLLNQVEMILHVQSIMQAINSFT